MKQILIPKPDITFKGKFNATREESLKILSCNNDELLIYLQEQLQHNPFVSITGMKELDVDAYLEYDHSKCSLSDEVMEQLQLSDVAYDMDVCAYLISQLDGNGYFKIQFEALCQQSGFLQQVIQYHLDLLHQCTPYGAFAFDLRQCLQLQCVQSDDPASETAYDLCDYLEAIALKQFDEIALKLDLSIEEIQEGFAFIQSLNPKPAVNYTTETIYVNPEFNISVVDKEIQIQFLDDELSVRIQAEEEDVDDDLQTFLQSSRKQVNSIMNSIQKRKMTLLQIMQYICNVQRDYFLHHQSLQHLTLAMIAQHCNLHISTISRAIANKSFEFEHHYTFIRAMLSHGGTLQNSQEDIKKQIMNIIQNEDPAHPYSDEAIRKLLSQQEIMISRRAIAKYRDACFIYNSTKRKIQKR